MVLGVCSNCFSSWHHIFAFIPDYSEKVVKLVVFWTDSCIISVQLEPRLLVTNQSVDLTTSISNKHGLEKNGLNKTIKIMLCIMLQLYNKTTHFMTPILLGCKQKQLKILYSLAEQIYIAFTMLILLVSLS